MVVMFQGSPAECRTSFALGVQERWYVVRTQPQREAQAARQLENQNYRVFLPRFLKNRRHARKFETVLAPLFPRYMFMILDLTRDRWRSVNGTYGVDRLLMQGGMPEPVPHELVEKLTSAAEADGVVRFSPRLKDGQTIRVTAGPFAELMGRLERLDDSGRVRVLLDLLGGKIPVVLPESLVIPTDQVA
jgi:transcription elongation factor/antiterminator RfaH